ncbi:hypothetical protein ESCO_006065 [Escovopsis weberi]|uniref:Transcription factor Iwr1 domain-containing protein n=1 Tax=Escovopsis weberi TaxID=150374 RepID=A0A0M9VS02_ESCWE|nr:hypothetical protein ESCO_006065 [Escovopsis weberi]
MSIPPQLIRVKRKRDDDSPVTFLQLEEGSKRHRSGKSNWVYQRRGSTAAAAAAAASRGGVPAISRNDAKPVIHVSRLEEGVAEGAHDGTGTEAGAGDGGDASPKRRKFHVSRAMLSQAPAALRHARSGPTMFVERGRNKIAPKPALAAKNVGLGAAAAPGQRPGSESPLRAGVEPAEPAEQRRLHRPGVANRSRNASRDAPCETPTRSPLPESLTKRHVEDMDRIVADMNEWVLNELGSNLRSMEAEKKKEAAERPKFRPKAPEKRYSERHPERQAVPTNEHADTPMADASEEEDTDEDWIIEEYVRVPAQSVALDISPSDIGILVLDGEKETMLFYGPPQDEDEDADEDDEDENAENHYTADYPEDEVDSDDEFDRHAYMFRNANASDDEEFDDDEYDDDDSDEMVMEGDDDDDARMSRIRAFMHRNPGL